MKELANVPPLGAATWRQTLRRTGGWQVWQIPQGVSIRHLVAEVRRSGLVQAVEPDYEGSVFASPNDPKFQDGTVWSLHNTGQSGGLPDADIDAPEGWDIRTSASNIVVAVVDTGVRATHEDLAANLWIHPLDGSHGTNALAGNLDTRDDSGHGTLVAGVLGAVGDNGKGVAGVAWQVQIMACKAFNNVGIGSVSAAVAAVEYALDHGANIINASWGFTNSMALSDAIQSARDAGVLVVTAPGNNGTDIDQEPIFPASYDFDNVVTVAYTDRRDELSVNSSFGATSVDLAAPGVQIYSTFGATDNFYFSSSGSSFAAAHVSGTLALMLAHYPADSPTQIRTRLFNAIDPLPSLAHRCVTGGRLNLNKALRPFIRLIVPSPQDNDSWQVQFVSHPFQSFVIESSTDIVHWGPVLTNITTESGLFEFHDEETSLFPARFYRAMTRP